MELYPWQQWLLREMLAERQARPEDGEAPGYRWAARTAAMLVPRQNGKGKVLEARELVELYLLGTGLTTHTAHEAATADKHFARMRALCSSHRELRRRLKPISARTGESESFSFGNGEWSIQLVGTDDSPGPTIEFRTRTGKGGRGFSGDLLVFDEAMYVSAAQANALVPTMSAKPNPQLIYAASAVDTQEHPDGATLGRVRARAIAGGDRSLLYADWSAEGDDPETVDVYDEQAIAQANPSLGYGMTWTAIDGERPDLTRRGFAVERMGVGAWPADRGPDEGALDYQRWLTLVEHDEPLTDPVALAVDTNPLRSSTSIVVVGWTPSGRALAEVIERRSGTGWVVERLKQLTARWDPCAVGMDSKGPAASLLPDLRKAGIEPFVTTYAELIEACSRWTDALNDSQLAHRDDPRLNDAVRTVQRRGTTDQTLFARAKGGEDITPLVAGAIARLALERFGDAPPAPPAPRSLPSAAGDLPTTGVATIGF